MIADDSSDCASSITLGHLYFLPVVIVTIFPAVTFSALINAVIRHRIKNYIDYISVIVELNPTNKYYSIFMNILSLLTFTAFSIRYFFPICSHKVCSKNLKLLNFFSVFMAFGMIGGGFIAANVEKSKVKWLHYVGAGIFLISQSLYAAAITLITLMTKQNWWYFWIRLCVFVTSTITSVIAMVGCLPQFQAGEVGENVVYYGAICEWVSLFSMGGLIATFIPEFIDMRVKIVCETDGSSQLF